MLIKNKIVSDKHICLNGGSRGYKDWARRRLSYDDYSKKSLSPDLESDIRAKITKCKETDNSLKQNNVLVI